MSLNKNKNKNKNKTFNKTGSTFPANGWDPALEAVAELPNFFEIDGWRDLPIDMLPGPAETAQELKKLLNKQAKMQDPTERQIRLPEIQLEAEKDTPYYQRVLTPTPSGSFAATNVLIDAMSQLGTVVGCYYKKKFMRPRPCQLEPRLEGLAGAGEIYLCERAANDIRHVLPLVLEPIGARQLHNISTPVRTFRIAVEVIAGIARQHMLPVGGDLAGC
jgi:hypothetical protein